MQTTSYTASLVVLAATLVTGQTGLLGSTPATPSVKFNNADFQNPRAPAQAAVFTALSLISGNPTMRTFQWTSQFDVSDVYLYVDGISTSIGHKSLGRTTSLGRRRRDDNTQMLGPQLNRPTSPPGGTAIGPVDISAQVIQVQPGQRPQRNGIVNITNISQLTQDIYAGKQLYFQLLWNNGTTEATYSRYFTVTTAQPGEPVFDALASVEVFRSEGKGLDPARPEGPPTALNDGTTPDSAQPKTSSTETLPTNTGSPGSDLDTMAVAAPAGLSAGATAGIAVGATIGGLLVFGAVVWFCLRRYRGDKRRRDAVSPDGVISTTRFSKLHGRGAHDHIAAEKEAGPAAHVTPTSPYMDESTFTVLYPQNQEQEHESPMNTRTSQIGPTTAMYQRAETPRHAGHRFDTLNTPTAVPAPAKASVATAARTSAQSPSSGAQPESYHHHLVEEGMTEEEIRRLVEEERELDHAIERAGHQ